MENTTENTMENTIAQKALDFLSNIPSEDFIKYAFSDDKSKCCAIGHLTRLTSNNPFDYTIDNCKDMFGLGVKIRIASTDYLLNIQNIKYADISCVNNGSVNVYTEPKPKDRVIHLLTDMVKNGY